MIGKGKIFSNPLPKHLILNNRNIFNQKTIANSFNECFADFEPKIASKMPQCQRPFEMNLRGYNGSSEEWPLSDDKRKTAFFYIKGGKSSGLDHKQNFNSLLVPLKWILDKCL